MSLGNYQQLLLTTYRAGCSSTEEIQRTPAHLSLTYIRSTTQVVFGILSVRVGHTPKGWSLQIQEHVNCLRENSHRFCKAQWSKV